MPNIAHSINIKFKFLPAFKEALEQELHNNLCKDVLAKLASLLAIHYEIQLKEQIPAEGYLNSSISRLKKFLGYKTITDKDFSIAMQLFIVAITSEDSIPETDNTYNLGKDTQINAILATHFSSYTEQERSILSEALYLLYEEKNPGQIIDFVNSDPKMFANLALTAKVNNKPLSMLAENVVQILLQEKEISNKSKAVQTIAAQLALVAGMFGVIATSIFTMGIASPLLIMPLSIGVMKSAPKLGGLIGTVVSDISGLSKKQATLKQYAYKKAITDLSTPLSHSQSTTINQEKQIPEKILSKIQEKLSEASIHKDHKPLIYNKDKNKNTSRAR